MVRYTNALLKKAPGDITDEELAAIGKHFLKYPKKYYGPSHKVVLHKCVNCRFLLWYANLGKDYWECYHNPCEDLKTQGHLLKSNSAIGAWRKCAKFEKADTGYK